METDEFKCFLCSQYFNDSNRVPRLLITCGHTYCQECLLSNSQKSSTFECPEDQIPSVLTSVEELPKNIALLKLLGKKLKKDTSLLVKQKEGNKLTLTKSSANFDNQIQSDESIKRKLYRKPSQQGNSFVRQSPQIFDYNSNSKKVEICEIHKKPIEVVCVEDKVMICANCALFGTHKNHDIRNEEEVFFELATKGEILIEAYQIISFNFENFEKREEVERIERISHDKTNNLIGKVENFYREAKNKLKSKKLEIISKINEKFENINDNNIKQFKKIPDNLSEKVKNWLDKAQSKLDILLDLNEKHVIDYELLEKKGSKKQIDLITESEDFIKEFEDLKGQKTNNIEEYLENIDVEYQDIFMNTQQIFKIVDKNEIKKISQKNLKCPSGEDLMQKIHFPTKKDSQKSLISNVSSYMDNTLLLDTTTSKPFDFLDNQSARNRMSVNGDLRKKTQTNNQFLLDNTQISHSTKSNEESIILQTSNFLNISEDYHQSRKSNITVKKSKMTNDKMVFIKQQFKNEIANFNCYDIGDEGAKVISQFIVTSSKLKELKLTKTSIGDEGAAFIFKTLSQNNSIVSLNLSKNLITDLSIDMIIESLKTNKTMKLLNLTSNSITNKEKLQKGIPKQIKLTL